MADPIRRNDPGEAQRLKEALLGPELAQLRDLVQRYGDDAALAESVRRVIVDVLRKAGVQDHDRVAEALAPLVVETVAHEIPRQHNQIARSLIPYANQLLAVGARRSMTSLARGVDAVASPLVWMQRAQGLMRGQPLALVQLGDGLWFEGMALLREETGTDVFTDFDPPRTIDMRVAAAAQPVADGEASPLRALGNYHWMVRQNGLVWIVAAHGGQARTIDADLARVFAGFSQHWRDTLAALGSEAPGPILAANLARDLEDRCRAAFGTAPGDRIPRPRPWFGYAAVTASLAVLLAWGGWQVWQNRQDNQIVAAAESALQENPALARLPLAVRYDRQGDRLIVRGVVADRALPETVEQALKAALPGHVIDVLVIAPPPAPKPIVQEIAPSADLQEQTRALFARLNAAETRIAQLNMQAWFAKQIIRFDKNTEYFDSALVEQQVLAIGQLFQEWPPEFNLRIVGFADATGSERSQEKAALDRALTVMQALISAGVPPSRLAAVGRAATKPLSFIHGDASINRRVEFEVYTPSSLGG